jgi:hypothetical protein
LRRDDGGVADAPADFDASLCGEITVAFAECEQAVRATQLGTDLE